LEVCPDEPIYVIHVLHPLILRIPELGVKHARGFA
jgi:hypothetical protein